MLSGKSGLVLIKKIGTIGLIFLLGLILFYFIGKEEVPSSLKISKIRGKMHLQGIELLAGNSGKLKWKLKAKQADYVGKEIILKNIVFEYMLDKHIFVYSDEGKIIDNNSLILLYPRVKIKMSDVILFCDKFIYDKNKKKIFMNDNFEMKKDNYFKVIANKALFDIKSNSFYILKNVKSIWWLENENNM